MAKAKYIETFAGHDYFRDEYGNVYAKIGGRNHVLQQSQTRSVDGG